MRRPQQPAVLVPVYEPTPQEAGLGERLDQLGLADVRGAGTARLPASATFAGYGATSQWKLFRPALTRPVRVRRERRKTAEGIRPETPGRAAMRTNQGG